MNETLLILSTALAIISPLSYVVSILRGTSRPHRITRFALCFVLCLNFASILAAHGNTGAKMLAGIFAAQALVVFALSIPFGMGGRGKFDWMCLGVATLGIVGWRTTGNPTVGVIFSVLADFSAYAPAIRKTWREPDSESHWTYTTSALAALLGLMAYPLSVASLFQLYIVVMDTAVVFCIYHKQVLRRLLAEAATEGEDFSNEAVEL